jgi:hypothetical protein
MKARMRGVAVLLMIAFTAVSFSQINYKTVSGYVRTSGGVGIAGVSMGGFPSSTMTDSLGYYSCMVPYYVFGSGTVYWSGTVIPSKTGYSFSPDSIVYSSVSSNLTNQNYTGSLRTFAVSGFVLTGSGAPIGNVSMVGLPGTPLTDGKGYYYATVTYGWGGTVTPTRSGVTFLPVSTNYKFVTADQRTDYTGTIQTFTIFGYVQDGTGAGIAGVTMSGLVGSPVTDTKGYYSAAVDYGWGGTVTPMKTGYAFTPSSTSYKMVLANTQTNYTAAVQVLTISGFVRTAAGTGVAGVAMSGLPGSPTTDGAGYYAAGVNYGWSGTVTPSKLGYTVMPSGTSYSSVAVNQSVNYTATLLTFVISGFVKTAALSPMMNVVMNGLPSSPVTNSIGFYSDTVGYGWQGTVTPSKSGYSFTPPSITYAGVLSSQSNQDYTGISQQGYTISGYVRTAAGAPITGVAMNGLPSATSSDASGFYSCPISAGWSGTVVPAKTGYSFSPSSLSYSSVAYDWTNQNYVGTASQQGYSISGYVRTGAGVAIDGVAMTGLPATTTTNADGFYSCIVPYGWNGNVTPVKGTFVFSPVSRSYTYVMSDQNAQNYVAEAQTCTISGYVRTSSGGPIQGVELAGLPDSPTTSANGFYFCQVIMGWSGTVTPTKAGYSFTPSSTTYPSVTANQSADYVGTQAQTWSISGFVRTSAGVGISGVVLSGLPANPVSDVNGYYAATVAIGWSGTATPTKSAYTFSPPSTTYSGVASNQITNYVGTQIQMYTISGFVRTVAGVGIAGVIMSGLPAIPVTDTLGHYMGTVGAGWSGMVIPIKAGCSFSPTATTYANVSANLTSDYRATLPTDIMLIQSPIPSGFRLGQNYPNPFNPSTTITYSLPCRATVILRVFNSIGQQVASLIEATQEPGTYSVGYDAHGLSSGIYFYRLLSTGTGSENTALFTDTKRLLVLQ